MRFTEHAPAREDTAYSFSTQQQLNFYPSYALVTQFSGGYVGGVTPVPIPNTEVKPSRADGTPRETAWESRSLPDFFEAPVASWAPGAFFCLFAPGAPGVCAGRLRQGFGSPSRLDLLGIARRALFDAPSVLRLESRARTRCSPAFRRL